MHGGEFHISSEPDVGTTVSFTLPYELKDNVAKHNAAPKSKTLLISKRGGQ